MNLFDWVFPFKKNDPVYQCDVFKDKDNGRCAHVDGMLCNMGTCITLAKYKVTKQVKEGDPFRNVKGS